MDSQDNNNNKKLQDDIRKNLQSILDSTDPKAPDVSMPPALNGADGGPAKIQHPNTKMMDFYQVKDDTDREARGILKSVMEFYVDKNILNKNEYIKFKKKVDEMSISSVLFSLKTCQHAMIKLLEEIDMGQLHPRNFEVLAALNGQYMSVVKHQAALMVTLEEGYKKVKYDHDQVEREKGKDDVEDAQEISDVIPTTVRGTRQLIQSVNANMKNDEKPVSENTEVPRLTDPKNRPDNPHIEEIKEEKKEDEENFKIDDENFG